MDKNSTIQALKDAWKDNEEIPELFFENAIGLIQYFAVQKNIEFDGYFRTKWEIEAEHPMTFDDEYFENENRSELYVYLAAEADEDIFECLKYAYNLVNEEEFTRETLHREIFLLREQGTNF
ncbi:hypothetical protein [Epilithonimonas sp.]|uniref:hypothetical protein n=1 Tax=Epilithonimonas sp. TaxID=2894511 RepID=UPI0035B059E0